MSNFPNYLIFCRFEWFKDGKRLEVDGNRIVWQKPSQSGTIIVNDAQTEDQGYYQCHASNIFGTAVSSKLHARLGGYLNSCVF